MTMVNLRSEISTSLSRKLATIAVCLKSFNSGASDRDGLPFRHRVEAVQANAAG
jgi:hypothetical protein